MKKIFIKIFTFFFKKDTIKDYNGSTFYNNVIIKGKKEIDSELFDKKSNNYLFKV